MPLRGPAVAGILTLLVGVVAAVLLLLLVPESDFRPDYLLVGSIPVAIVVVAGALLLGSGFIPTAVRATVLSWAALIATVASWFMIVAAFSFAVLYLVSGGPMTINPFWWWLLPVGVALWINGGALGLLGVVRRWRLVPSLIALVLAAIPVLLLLLLFLPWFLPIFGTSAEY